MAFAVSADAYDRFMGRYSTRLAPLFADFAGVAAGMRVLDVGCGPGALTAELVRRAGAEDVAAIDPSESFVAAARERHPGVDVRRAAAEELPFGDGELDAALAQLVVHFMADPPAGIAEMARVTRAGGTVAACVWDYEGGRTPLSLFWRAALELDPVTRDESDRAGARQGALPEFLSAAALRDVEETLLAFDIEHATFDEWWDPFALGVGPAGSYVRSLDPDRLAKLRERCRELAGDPPLVLPAAAWAARGRVG